MATKLDGTDPGVGTERKALLGSKERSNKAGKNFIVVCRRDLMLCAASDRDGCFAASSINCSDSFVAELSFVLLSAGLELKHQLFALESFTTASSLSRAELPSHSQPGAS